MIKAKIQADLFAAMKSGDKPKVETLRFILAQIKNKEIEKREDITDEETVNVLRKQIKELKESLEAFEKGNRADLAAENNAKIEITTSYLPAEISDEELLKEIERIKAANAELYQKSPKALIGICIKELRSKADPSRITKLVG
jgi:uncharacterized protein